MSVFEFVIILVFISTVGKVLSDWRPRVKGTQQVPQLPPGEVDRIHETMEHLAGRLARLEEERDFYKNLLDAPPDSPRETPDPK